MGPPAPRAEGSRAARRAGVDDPWLLEAVDQGGEHQRVEDRGHGTIVAIGTHNLK
jgi:hypothetical protein